MHPELCLLCVTPDGFVLPKSDADRMKENETITNGVSQKEYIEILKLQAEEAALKAERDATLKELVGKVTVRPTFLPKGSKNIFDCI